MVQSKQKKGVVEWVVFLLPVAVVAVTVIVTYVRLDERVKNACEKWEARITQIDERGSRQSNINAKDIVELKTLITTIDNRLKRLEDGQNTMIRLLKDQQ